MVRVLEAGVEVWQSLTVFAGFDVSGSHLKHGVEAVIEDRASP